MASKDYSGTRKNVSKTMLGNLAETLGFKKGLSYKQLMTEAASLSQKAVKQGLKRAGWKGAAALAALEAVGYGASKLMEKSTSKDKPTTKSKTKTYAEMVKEDKAKGKNKVLSRRAPETPPRKPKKLRDKPTKEELKFNMKTGDKKGTAKERLEEIKREKLAKKQKELVKKGKK